MSCGIFICSEFILNSFRCRSVKGNQTILSIPVADSVMSDLYSSFERICSFIGESIVPMFYLMSNSTTV